VRRMTMFLSIGMLVAACGGDAGDDPTETIASDSSETSAPQSSEDEQPDTTAAAPAEDDGDTADSGGDASSGTVVIAGESYEFIDNGFPGLQCMPDSFGVAFIAALQPVEGEVDGVIGGLTVAVPFEGEGEVAGILPAVSISVGELEWIADEEHAELNDLPAGSSQVDSYEIDGNTISGAATFYERNSSFTGNPDDLIVETGTFEVTCVDG